MQVRQQGAVILRKMTIGLLLPIFCAMKQQEGTEFLPWLARLTDTCGHDDHEPDQPRLNMKRTVLLNRDLSMLIASLGHTDEVVLADAGLPVPAGVPVIDLAVSAGVPAFFDVLTAMQSELVIETAIHATEASPALQARFVDTCAIWQAETGKPIAIDTLSHDAFKTRTAAARAVIRTGECTPYCNLILRSGVPF